MSTAAAFAEGGALFGLRRAGQVGLYLWNRLSMYMPLVMMGALALGTYWLVNNAPLPGSPEAAREARHEVDYFMRRFTIKNFDEMGKFKSEVLGVEARHFTDTDILEIDQVRIRSINPKGLVTVATANRAYSNGDGSEVQLVGNAVVVREAGQDTSGKQSPRMEFRGEFLHAFLNEDRVQSHKPVVLIRGADQFTGDSLAYDNLDQVVNLKGRVRGVLMPKAKAAPGAPPARPAPVR